MNSTAGYARAEPSHEKGPVQLARELDEIEEATGRALEILSRLEGRLALVLVPREPDPAKDRDNIKAMPLPVAPAVDQVRRLRDRLSQLVGAMIDVENRLVT